MKSPIFTLSFEIYSSQGRHVIKLIVVTPLSRELYVSSYSTFLAVQISHI